MTVLVAQFAACGSDDPTGTTGGTPVSVASVAVTPDSANLTALGLRTQFQAVAKDAAGHTLSGKTFSWASTATGVATVNPTSGRATAVTNGTTTIRATTDGVSGTASLTVAQALAAVQVTPPLATLVSPGQTLQLTAGARDVTGNAIAGQTFTFTWSSSDESLATVSSTGLVTSLANGPRPVTITAATDGVQGRAAIRVGARPSARGFHAMAYDAESDRVILFGGGSENFIRLQDTWAYDLDTNTWTDMSPISSPSGRNVHAMAYDAQSDRVILFGGGIVGGTGASDTWAYDFNTNTWTDMSPISSPGSRILHRMVYDARSDRVILFGGLEFPANVFYDETWAYDFDTNAWTQLSPSTKPFGRVCFAMAYDAESDRVVLFGAETDQGLFADTWAYDFNTNDWTDMNPAPGPSVQNYQAMAYDAGSDRAILFGGAGGSETWAYDFNTNVWANMNSLPHPSGRWGHKMAYDEGSGRVVLFGGLTVGPSRYDDTWAYDFNTDTWTLIH